MPIPANTIHEPAGGPLLKITGLITPVTAILGPNYRLRPVPTVVVSLPTVPRAQWAGSGYTMREVSIRGIYT